MKKTSIIAIGLILLALIFIVLGVFVNQYKVFDQPENTGELSGFTTMKEPQLMEEMNYDAIITDAQGNLINKKREAACST